MTIVTNIGAKYAFPLKSESPGIAKRLAQIGFNLVRFHLFDKEIFQDNNQIKKIMIDHVPQQFFL